MQKHNNSICYRCGKMKDSVTDDMCRDCGLTIIEYQKKQILKEDDNNGYIPKREYKQIVKISTIVIILALVFGLLVFVDTVNAAVDLENNLTYYWNLSNSLASSKTALTLTSSGTIGNPVGKVYANAKNNSGTAYLTQTFALVGNDYTFNTWFYPTGTQGAGDYEAVFRWGEPTQIYFYYDYNGNARLSVGGASTTCSVDYTGGISGSAWHMFTGVVVSGTGTAKMYIDGVNTNNCTFTGASKIASVALRLFQKLSDTTEGFDGRQGALGVWNIDLSSSNISLLYNSGSGCDIINNPSGCGAAPSTMTPTPTSLINTSNGYTNITMTWAGNYGSKYLIFRNGTNIANDTASPYTDTGLTSGTRYGYQVKAYNATYTIPLSNYSNKIEVRTKLESSLTLSTGIIQGGNYSMNPFIYNFSGGLTGITNTTFDCVLKDNSTSLFSVKVADIQVNHNLNFSTINQERTYNTTLTCSNNEDTATLSRRFFIDSVTPIITYSNGLNNSVFYKGVNTVLPYIIRFQDNNLYAVNSSLCYSASGNTCTSTLFNYNNKLYNDDDRLINYTNALSTLPAAYNRFLIFSQAWDAHTAELLDKDFDIVYYPTLDKGTPINNKVEVEGIFLESKDLDSFSLVKNIDRYNFDVSLKQDSNRVRFNLKSDTNLTYLPTSEYLGHFIDFNKKIWLDFENENADSLSVKKISDFEYNVTVNMKPVDKGVVLMPKEKIITFESIGLLNHVTSTIYFNRTNSTLIKARDRISNTSIQNITVKVYTYPNTLIQTKSTTNYNISLNISSGTYYLNISGNAGGVSYVTNVTANKTFSNNLIYSTYLTLANSLYLLIYDEQTNQLIDDRNATVDIINYANVSASYTTETGTLFKSNFAAGDYEINYKADNYTARSYYTTIVGSDTQSIRLYLLSDLDTTHQYLTYSVVDDSAIGLSNATLAMQRYFISDNAWRTVEMSKSNDAGQGFIFAELYDAAYRFVIVYEGVTEKITSQTKLDTRSLLFSLALLDSGLTHYWASGDVATSLVYSNTTKIWTFNYNAAGITDVENGRFQVSKITPTIRSTICNVTLAATSGGLTCNLTSYYGDSSTFLGEGFIEFSGNNAEYMVESGSLILNTDYLKYGLNGVWLGFIAIGTITMVGLFSPVAAIIMALFGLVITSLMGLVVLSYTWLVGIILVGIIYIYSVRQP